MKDSVGGSQKKVDRGATEEKTTFLSRDDAFHHIKGTLSIYDRMAKGRPGSWIPGCRNRLEQWLMRMERGNRKDHRTPFFLRFDYPQIVDYFTTIVDKSSEHLQSCYSINPKYAQTLIETEKAQADKVIGPRGVFPPAHEWITKQFDALYAKKTFSPELNRSALMEALNDLSDLVKPGTIEVAEDSYLEGFKTADSRDEDASALNVTTNSCFPTYVKGWFHRDKSKASPVQWAVQMVIMAVTKFKWLKAYRAKSWEEVASMFHFPATGSQRTNVANGCKPKSDNSNIYQGVLISKLRAVSAMPKEDTTMGKAVLNRLIRTVLGVRNPDGTCPFVSLSTPEVIDKSMQISLETAHNKKIIPLSTDYSHYDQSVNPDLAWLVAKAVSSWMGTHCRKIFLGLVRAAFYQTSMITPTKVYREGPSSMKSGSWMTNIMDSLINWTVQQYGYRAGLYDKPLSRYINGDDAVLIAHGATPESFEICARHLGFEANKSKQGYAVDTIFFNQKIHFYGYPGGVYPICRSVGSCLSLEDDVGIETDETNSFPYVLAFRTTCRLGTAVFNPNFVKLIQIFKSEDQIHLGASLPPGRLAKLAGSYATKWMREIYLKPWKSTGSRIDKDFKMQPVERVIRGELPPPPGRDLFYWVYGIRYEEVSIDELSNNYLPADSK